MGSLKVSKDATTREHRVVQPEVLKTPMQWDSDDE